MKKLLIAILFLNLLFCFSVLAAEPKTVNLDNPLKFNEKGTAVKSPAILIGYIIQAVLGVVGGVALVMMVYGGFQWLTSAGSEEKVKSGTQTMLWSAIGLVLVFSSYIIANTVMNIITGKI